MLPEFAAVGRDGNLVDMDRVDVELHALRAEQQRFQAIVAHDARERAALEQSAIGRNPCNGIVADARRQERIVVKAAAADRRRPDISVGVALVRMMQHLVEHPHRLAAAQPLPHHRAAGVEDDVAIGEQQRVEGTHRLARDPRRKRRLGRTRQNVGPVGSPVRHFAAIGDADQSHRRLSALWIDAREQHIAGVGGRREFALPCRGLDVGAIKSQCIGLARCGAGDFHHGCLGAAGVVGNRHHQVGLTGRQAGALEHGVAHGGGGGEHQQRQQHAENNHNPDPEAQAFKSAEVKCVHQRNGYPLGVIPVQQSLPPGYVRISQITRCHTRCSKNNNKYE